MSSKVVARRSIEKIFREDESLESVRLALHYQKDIQEGKYEEDYVNAIVQHGHYSSFFDLYDAFIFAVIDRQVKEGKLYFQKIRIGSTPSQNHEVEENNRKLKSLPKPFTAAFIPTAGSSAEDDGYLESVTGKAFLTKYENGEEKEMEVSMPSLRLEVGTTQSHTTYRHIFRHQGVARWPYFSEYLYIIYNPTPFSVSKYLEEQAESDDVSEERGIAEKEVLYRGKMDNEALKQLFQFVNETVEKHSLPTNLYTFSSSQIDLAVIDFKYFDLDETQMDHFCVATLRNHHNVKTNHLVIRPNTVVSVTVDIRVASDEMGEHQFLAINFTTDELVLS